MAGSKVGSAWYELRADDAKLKGDLNRATGTITTSGSTAGRGFSSGFTKGLAGIKSAIGSFGPLLGALGAAFAATKIVDFLGEAVRAAREEEASIATLTQSIKANDAAWDGNIESVEKVIESRQALGFADDEQRDSLRTLVALTHDTSKALDIQRLAMDFARLKGISLADATTLLGKVYGGNFTALRKMGIQIEAGASSTEAFAIIQGMAAGQAEVFGNTAEGAALSAGIAFENLKEDLGKLLLPALRDISLFIVNDLIPAIRSMASVIGPVLGTIADGIGQVGTMIDDVNNVVSAPGNFLDHLQASSAKTGDDISAMKGVIIDRMNETGESFEQAAAHFAESFDPIPAHAGKVSLATLQAVEGALAAGGPVIAEEAGKIAGMLPAEIQAQVDEVRTAGANQVVAFAAGVLEKQNDPMLAFDAMLKAQETALTRQEEITRLQGALQSTELAAGLNDERPAVQAAAAAARLEIVNRLATLGADGYTAGQTGGAGIPRGLDTQKTAVGDAAARLRGVGAQNMDMGTVPATHGGNAGKNFGTGIGNQYYHVEGKARGVASGAAAALQGQTKYAEGWGKSLGEKFAGGLSKSAGTARNAGYAVAAAAAQGLRLQSPAEAGPLSDPGVDGGWGLKLGAMFAGGMLQSVDMIRRASGAMGGAAVPRVGPMPITNFGAAGAFGSSGATTNLGGIVININGFSGSQGDIENVSRRLADSIRLRARTAF